MDDVFNIRIRVEMYAYMVEKCRRDYVIIENDKIK